jgi:prevent-host-death family protein
MSVEVNVHEAKTHLSRLLEQAMAGEGVVIMKSGRRLARLVPVESAPVRRQLGTAKGDFVVPEDFDAPLPEGVLREFEK